MMLRDHLEALALLTDRGLPLEKALARLDPGQLGGFYLSERTDWYPLDHAAKIYPMSMGLKRMMVFRLSCYLKKPVEPAIMQMALSYTIRRFPYFATTVKCGFFWHYIDSAMRRFAVRQESKLPRDEAGPGILSHAARRVLAKPRERRILSHPDGWHGRQRVFAHTGQNLPEAVGRKRVRRAGDALPGPAA